MFIRRIAVIVCALCLAAATAAGAQPIHDPSPGHADRVGHEASLDKQTPGDAYSQLSRAKALGHVDRIGSLTAEQLAAAYGTAKPAPSTHASIASTDDDTNGWRIAAVTAAALFAALALASLLITRARRRAPRMSM